ncbi:hypothetical protein [Leifsonia shinshuensis]|uniref:hypothetical protein n=1 Tax=Leifsonia shinshuensis TaxID=150026 RepID=UPI002864A231|nr:hypothetical protein [Leifsonia shinshuensis]MDR6970765.1 hypothetical protein [Leifsonia shinshuensis]
MGLFRRRKDEPQPEDRIEWVTSVARRILAEQGVETTIEHGAEPEDVRLIAVDGQVYPLFNAFAKTHGATAEQATKAIAEHIENLLVAQGEPSPAELSADELRRQVRTRILPGGEGRPNEPTFRYARPFTDELIVALCVDFPTTIHFINDSHIDDLALSLDELYAYGQLNTDQEPVGEHFEPAPGIHVIVGDSLFTASKAANLPAVLGAAPLGTLFTLPHRHILIAAPITGPETLAAVEHLVNLTQQVLSGGPPPGGVISADVLFSRNRQVSRVSSMDEHGEVSIVVDDRLQEALEEAIG